MGNLKGSFALYAVLVFVLIFATISLMFVETKLINSQLDNHKYFHLQAKLHLDSVVDFIKINKKAPNITVLTDYEIAIYKEDNKTFDIFVGHKNQYNYINLHRQLKLP